MIFNSSIRIRINSTINQKEQKKSFSFNFPFLPLNANVIHDNIWSIIQQKPLTIIATTDKKLLTNQKHVIEMKSGVK